MNRSPIGFYFDYVSPYAYLAWTQIRDLAAPYGRDVTPIPVLFAGLLSAHGNVGPAEIPAKRRYILRDVARTAAGNGIPLALPPSHPFNPLLALRVTCAELDTPHLGRLVDAMYRAVWGTGGGAETVEQVTEVLVTVGLDPADVLARAAAPEVKARLRANTDAAIAAGVFGVPTMIADGELFWGFDAFPNLDQFLAGAAPPAPSLLARWETLTASATRRRD